ncbi:MAG: hypothetical protein IPM98_20290, partial [Lewinellaceae bacterium]|nr:hypothetical protein [Lewinellaceae bacterium]
TLTRTWKATDLCGNSTLKAQVITVQDTQAPTFTNPPADLTVVCAPDCVPFPVTPNAIDNCGSPSVTLQETQSAGDCATGYTVTRTWTATDQCGNPNVHTQTITVLPAPQPFAPGLEDERAKTPPATFDRERNAPLETENSKLKTVQLLPNPTSDWVSIGLGDFAGAAAVVSITNELGQLIWEKRFEIVEDVVQRVNLRQAGAPSNLFRRQCAILHNSLTNFILAYPWLNNSHNFVLLPPPFKANPLRFRQNLTLQCFRSTRDYAERICHFGCFGLNVSYH